MTRTIYINNLPTVVAPERLFLSLTDQDGMFVNDQAMEQDSTITFYVEDSIYDTYTDESLVELLKDI